MAARRGETQRARHALLAAWPADWSDADRRQFDVSVARLTEAIAHDTPHKRQLDGALSDNDQPLSPRPLNGPALRYLRCDPTSRRERTPSGNATRMPGIWCCIMYSEGGRER